MRPLRAFFLRLANLLRHNRQDRDLSSELESHLQFHIEENLRSGMSPAEARRRALLKLGGLEQTKLLYRDRRGLPILEMLFQDIRFGARILRKNPGFTCIAVLTLALGIGANTAIFSMVNALLLHPYTFPGMDSLVRVWENRGLEESYDARFIAPADAADFFSSANVFESLTLYRDRSFNLSKEGGVEPVLGCEVSANFFDVLGVAPAFGRGFLPAEEQSGSDRVAILSNGLWQQRFGGDPAILGKAIRLNGRIYNVVGVMPPKFSYPVPSQLWVPLSLTPPQKADRSSLSVSALARLKPGVTPAKAGAALAAISRQIETQFPRTNAGRTAVLLQLRRELYLYTVPLFLLLQLAAVLVLLLAGANLANLMFARLIGRQKEIAMRTALGAGRRRLGQLFLSETMMLSFLAGAAAFAISFGTVRLLRGSISEDWTKWVPGWSEIHVDPAVLTFTLLLSALLGLAFGIATIFRTGRLNLNLTLKEGGPGTIARSKARLRSALVVSQVVLALVLLVCAGLMIQGFARLADVYAAFDLAKVLRVEISLPQDSYSNDTAVTNFYRQLLDSASSLSGVTSVSLSTNQPASNVDNDTTFFTTEGRPVPKQEETPSADVLTISADYFSVLRVPLISGRLFSETDSSFAPQVAIISRSMAARFWSAEDALGKRIRLGAADSRASWTTVVGIVADVRENWWNSAAQPVIYLPFRQSPQRSMTLLLRTSNHPASYVSSLREMVRRQDADVALRGVNTLQTEVTDSIGLIRIMGILMGVFGIAALALSSMGVYGVLSESVAQRTREIGIRFALGATSRDVLKIVLGHTLRLTLAGVLIALPVCIAVGKLMTSAIYGLVSFNLFLLLAFAALLLVVALLAGYLPARRAMRVDPMVALRYE